MSDVKVEEVSTAVAVVVGEAMGLVQSQEDYDAAAAYLVACKSKQSEVKDFFKDTKSKALAAHRAICAQERQLLDPLETAEAKVKAAMAAYVRREEERRREEARRREEEERVRQEAERKRLEEERAKASTDPGWGEYGESQEDAPAPVPAVPEYDPLPEAPRAAGVSHRKKFRGVVFDEALLPREFLMPNQSAIDKVVAGLGVKANIPGVRVEEEIIISGRRA